MAFLFQNFVNNEFQNSASGRSQAVRSPWDGSIIGDFAVSEAMDFVMALAPAKKALQEYSNISIDERRNFLQKLIIEIESRIDLYLRFENEILGMHGPFLKQTQVLPAMDLLRIRHHESLEKSDLKTSVGIVGVLLPATDSFKEFCTSISSAILSGSPLMVKASSHSPYVSLFWGEVIKSVGLPAGFVQIFNGSRQQIGDFFISHPSLRAFRFYGQYSSLVQVMKSASQGPKKYQALAKGKNTAVLLEDLGDEAEYQKFFDTVFQGQGQTDSSVHKIFILESFGDKFWQEVHKYIAKVKPNAKNSNLTSWNPLISQEHVERLKALSQQSANEHGKVVKSDASPQDGFFGSPVFIRDLPNCSELQQDSLSAPLVIVTSVKYSHEIVKWANNSYLPKRAWIFGEQEKAVRLAEKLEYSHVAVNTWENCGTTEIGIKSCFYGDSDESPWGAFWTYAKKMTLPS